jgi:hypothetical protein
MTQPDDAYGPGIPVPEEFVEVLESDWVMLYGWFPITEPDPKRLENDD